MGTIVLQAVTVASHSKLALLSPSVQTYPYHMIIAVDLIWRPSLVLSQTD